MKGDVYIMRGGRTDQTLLSELEALLRCKGVADGYVVDDEWCVLTIVLILTVGQECAPSTEIKTGAYFVSGSSSLA